MNRLKLWLPAVLWMIVIFLLSGRQSTSVSDEYWLNFLFFKTLHVIEYAILYILLWRSSHNFLYAFILTILYAMTDEFHQTFVPTREGRVRDVIIDALGAGVAWLILSKLLQKMPGKLQKWVRGWLESGRP